MVLNESPDRKIKSEQGQTMAEYGVVLAMITFGVVSVITALSGGIQKAFERAIALIP